MWLVRLARLGSFLCLCLLTIGITEGPGCLPNISMSSGNWKSGPHTCMANTLTTEQSYQTDRKFFANNSVSILTETTTFDSEFTI